MYKFRTENNGDTNNNYEIYLGDNEISSKMERMSDSIIKYRLQKVGDFDKTGYISDLEIAMLKEKNSSQEKEYKKLDTGKIEIDGGETYILQVWIDYNADNKIANQAFSKSLRLEASQIVK